MTEKNAQYFANIAIIIGVPIAVVSLMASGYGLYLNRDAINANREAIVAQTAYQMQLDGRSQMEKLFENPEIFSVMLERVPYEEIDDSLLVKAGPLVLSFFSTIQEFTFSKRSEISQETFGRVLVKSFATLFRCLWFVECGKRILRRRSSMMNSKIQ